MNSYAYLELYIIKIRTLCKSTDVNCLWIGDVVWGTKIYHQFTSFRRGTKYTGGL